MIWAAFWRAVLEWWARTHHPDAALNVEAIDSLARQLTVWADEEGKRDWFAWEGEQYAKCPSAFWFDHWRYEGTPFAYPEPPVPSRLANWNASLQRMIAVHGDKRMREIGNAMVEPINGDSALETRYYRAMAPWEWVVTEYQQRANI